MIKELFSRPGKSIREFINGKRVKYLNPLSFVILVAGIYAILAHLLSINTFIGNISMTGDSGNQLNEANEDVNKITEWVLSHYALFSLAQVPVFSLGTYLSFKSSKYNFVEHLVINSYLTGQRLLLHIIVLPILYFSPGSQSFKIVDQTVTGLGLLLTAWALYSLFDTLSISQRIWKILLSFTIAFIIIAILLLTSLTLFISTLK
jgi:hypothetical protein